MLKYFPILFVFGFLTASCTTEKSESPGIDWNSVQDSTNIAYTVTGLDGPEAVRYDADQDVYFIANFTGGGNDQDSTGFITKADAEGNIIEREFMSGTKKAPLHAPRGMFLVNETLWAADVLGLHGFNKETGEQTDFVDFSEFEIGFLNDVSANENGVIYVTDTGNPRVYKVENGAATIFLDSLEISPNGITLDPENKKFVLAPWNGETTFYTFNTEKDLVEYNSIVGGYFDGLEFLNGKLLLASQQDSSIRVFDGNESSILIKTSGRPADIGINTQSNHIAVPYIALDRVEIWDLTN